ncbi:hypothetical protein CHS0354_004861 [Potamilus streckersoni]|uniref:Tafazzin family protein n=1 Tax=Potamilus streckersoni TaxID=2493646 RepID=A0AAE0S900_9BIVA|nr:hypothetical protein CHS0354_004861 [Potamilus streckersoni]
MPMDDRWPVAKSRRMLLSWSIPSRIVTFAGSVFCKIWLEWFNRVKFYNAEVFHQAVDKRDPERGLLTICNHYSCMDDPLVWGMMKWRHVINANKVRWSTAAADICFTNRLNSLFFSLGQTIPICRGEGVYQKSMDYCIEELNEGGFVHIFPEGKVNMDKKSTRLKWGVGRLIADCKITPLVLPIYHIGMDDILPNSAPYIPRIRKNVTILVGKPMEFGKELEMLQKLKKNQREIRKHITDIIQEELRILKEKAEQLHRTHFGTNEP